MSGLALTRLVTAGNRSSRFRLVGIAAGVMIGVSLFLLLFSASQAFGERNLRSTWIDLISPSSNRLPSADVELASNEAAVVGTIDHFGPELIRAMQIAIPVDSTIEMPGVARIPKPGEYVASPAMIELIELVPADQLGDRYGTAVGVVEAGALEGPDSLVIVVGATVTQVAMSDSMTGAQLVTEFVGYDYSSQAYRIIAIIGAIAVLIPTLLLISIVTDLGAVQRAERFATLRLVGATPQQVARIAAVETALTTLIGAILGVGLYLAVIPIAARLEIGTSRFYPSDLLTSPGVMVVVALATMAGATGIAWWRTRRAGIGPLGAIRERQERPTRVVALLPLLLGVGCFASGLVVKGMSLSGWLLVVGFILTTLGLLFAGPVLTRWVARAGAENAHTGAQVIGFNRIVRHPRATFRAVAGLVVAVYTVTVFAVGITTAAGVQVLETGAGYLPAMTLYTSVPDGDRQVLDDAIASIRKTPGVQDVVLARSEGTGSGVVMTTQDAVTLGAPEVQSSSGYVAIGWNWFIDAPAAPEPVATSGDDGSGTVVMIVATDGSLAAVERARTAIFTSGIELYHSPITRADNTQTTLLAMENQFAALAYTGILIAAALSTVSLAVSTLAALISRQRVFGLLKLTGMSKQTLRSIITYETVLPVATVFFISIALGVFTAWAIIKGVSPHRTIGWPDPSYYLILAVCVALIGVAIGMTSQSATRLFRGSITRFE